MPAVCEDSGLADDQWLYFVTLVVTAVMFVLAAFLVRGRVGRALVAIRDNEIAARTMGVDLARFKIGTFAVSATYAGLAGALFTLPIGFLAPESFPLALSFAFLAAIVVGGLATIAGALFGALFIEFVPVYAADVDEAIGDNLLDQRALLWTGANLVRLALPWMDVALGARHVQIATHDQQLPVARGFGGVALERLQEPDADLGRLRHLAQIDPAQLAFAAEVVAEGGHGGFEARRGAANGVGARGL